MSGPPCPMPKRNGVHKITDRDGVISCVLCHKTWERDGRPTYDLFGETARAMADRWDAAQCPPRWFHREPQASLFGDAA